MANWHFGHTRNWYLNFGPYIGFLTSASENTRGRDLKNYFNSTDGGLDLGIGVKFPLTRTTKFFLEVNGQGGLVDAIKNNTGTEILNNSISANIGINF